MPGVCSSLSQFYRKLHTMSHDGLNESLRRKLSELQRNRRRRNPKKNQLYVDVPESKSYLDTATMPMILTAIGTALFAKLLMMEDIKDWTVDVLADALIRAEETARFRNPTGIGRSGEARICRLKLCCCYTVSPFHSIQSCQAIHHKLLDEELGEFYDALSAYILLQS